MLHMTEDQLLDYGLDPVRSLRNVRLDASGPIIRHVDLAASFEIDAPRRQGMLDEWANRS